MSESIQYKHTVDGMAKHIVYGNYSYKLQENKFYSVSII